VRVTSPSVALIPPLSVHTSQAVVQVRNQLIDILCPPRRDFVDDPGRTAAGSWSCEVISSTSLRRRGTALPDDDAATTPKRDDNKRATEPPG